MLISNILSYPKKILIKILETWACSLMEILFVYDVYKKNRCMNEIILDDACDRERKIKRENSN
jgi:hypothetical protein